MAQPHHRTLVLVHTVVPLIDEFATWCADILPGVATLHILDEPLLERVRRHDGGTRADIERLAEHVALAESIGADAVLVTCSTISTFVDPVRARASVPIIKIDEAMATEAVRLGPRVALVATNETTIEPSRSLIVAEAERTGRPVEVTTKVVVGALPALLQGSAGVHDRLIELAIRDLAGRSDVIVLAQASMARVMRSIAGSPTEVPVLSSPELALRQVRQLMPAMTAGPAPSGTRERP